LAEHLRQVAALARRFGEPLGLGDEAELAGLMHDLGKYSERFQARLRDPAVRGINHWAAGTAHTAAARLTLVAFAIDGHHTGIPARDGDGIRQTIAKMFDDREREEFCRCQEAVPELVQRCQADGIRFPEVPPRKPGAIFAEALRTRMLFSCLVDADFLDTEAHFNPDAAEERPVPKLQPSLAFRFLMDHLGRFPTGGDLNRRRRNLLADCIASAEKPPGLFDRTAKTAPRDVRVSGAG